MTLSNTQLNTLFIDSTLFSVVGRFLKNAWNKEPVITVSCGLGLMGECEMNVQDRVMSVHLPAL